MIMTTDELLLKLPDFIGNNRSGRFYKLTKPTDQLGHLILINNSKDWIAGYKDRDEYVCMNPESKKPPYNNAKVYGATPNEALKNLYDWCIENKFIKQ